MFKKLLAVLIVSFILAGCGDSAPKMDVSSKDAFQTSMKEMSAALEGNDKDAFQAAVVKVVFTTGLETDGDDVKIQQKLQEKLGGKTAKEIINEYGNK